MESSVEETALALNALAATSDAISQTNRARSAMADR